MSKVLIIGGTGTISYPITELLSDSMDVTILNRGNKKIDLDVEVIIGDIYDEDLVIDGFYDVVINFLVFDEKHARRNIELFKGKTNQFIFISTNVVLNHHEHCVINENTPIGNRVSVYGQDKAMCERVFMEESDFPVTIVRPSHTFSKDRFPVSVKGKNTWTVIQRMIDGKEILVHDMGQSIWPITHASDFARLFVSLVGNEKAIGEIYHIQNPELHTWDMIYQEVARQLGVEYKPFYIPTDILSIEGSYDFDQSIRGDKMYSNIFDISKILEINPDFEFEYDLKKSVREFLEYMNDHPELKWIDKEFDEYSDRMIDRYSSLKETLNKT